MSHFDTSQLTTDIKQWAAELGFQQLGITDTDLSQYEARYDDWIAAGYHADLDYMTKHGTKRTRPEALVPDTLRVLSVRFDYLPPDADMAKALGRPTEAYISRYALGRDYHKVLRKKLAKLARRIEEAVGQFGYRVFVDSAPVLEKPLAEKAGLGWIGKHSNLINKKAGSWFFLGEIYTDLPLPTDAAATQSHCGSCTACSDICPTQAIVAPYQVDARRCISYLTIENKGAIPEALRPLMGNRIYGCDDCQIVCPWNRFAKVTTEPDFLPRKILINAKLTELFSWTKVEFLERTLGSAIRRAGYEGWQRNLAVAMGNAPYNKEIIQALEARLINASPMVEEHILWALEQQRLKEVK